MPTFGLCFASKMCVRLIKVYLKIDIHKKKTIKKTILMKANQMQVTFGLPLVSSGFNLA